MGGGIGRKLPILLVFDGLEELMGKNPAVVLGEMGLSRHTLQQLHPGTGGTGTLRH